jgi:hypothetical protein
MEIPSHFANLVSGRTTSVVAAVMLLAPFDVHVGIEHEPAVQEAEGMVAAQVERDLRHLAGDDRERGP